MERVFTVDETFESPEKELRRERSAPAYLAVCMCVGMWLLLFVTAPGLLRYVFVATSFVCAAYLFWRHELEYVSFTWWLYFLTPFIRRVVDYRIGFDPSGMMLAAPLLATAVSCRELLKSRRLDSRDAPFVLLTLGVAYGLPVSLIMGTPVATAGQYFLAWIGPVAFGYLLYVRWPRRLEFRERMQNTFKWGLLVMGIYGVIQYLYAPAWDCFWMQNLSERIASFGTPERMGIRVFSTMNAPQPFALTLVIGLLITFYGQTSLLQKVAWIAGYAALLLSMARSAWLEWAIAIVALAFVGRSRKILSTVLVAILFVVALGAIATKLPMGEAVVERFQTLKDVGGDASGQERAAGLENVLKASLSSPFGKGWRIEDEGNNAMPIHDNTAVELLLCTGWLSFLMFYGAIFAASLIMFKDVRVSGDKLVSIVCSMLLALLVETALNSLLGGATELGLCTCIGLGLAASRHEEQIA